MPDEKEGIGAVRVRAYDSATDAYFSSDVYAILNQGCYERQLLLMPCADGDYFKLFDRLGMGDEPGHPKVLINTILPSIPEEWVCHSGSDSQPLKGFDGFLDEHIRFDYYYGFDWIFQHQATMIRLLEGNEVSVVGSTFAHRILSSKEDGWNYIESHEDIVKLMTATTSFHDSVLRSIDYTSGSYVTDDRRMYPHDVVRKVTAAIDSQICGPIELVFEGVIALNLRPSPDNYDSMIFRASILLKDSIVYFYDDDITDIHETYQHTWISAYSLRWRFLS